MMEIQKYIGKIVQNSKKLDASVQITPEWSLSSYFWDQIWKIPYNFRCWSGISVEGRESISSKEGWAAIVAISKASKSRATSVASKARAKAQRAEAAASTATAEAQAAEASVAAAQASVVAAAMAHGVRGVSLVCCQSENLSVDVSTCRGMLIYPGQSMW